jgi:hypothetical protein
MSAERESQLREDRALRDAALALLHADIANLRANFSGKSISSRLIERIGDGAADVFDEAVEVAESHKGVLATLLAAIVLWFARNPIIALFDGDDSEAVGDAAERDKGTDR